MKEFDYIIIGGGCAGLSLAYELEIYDKLKDKTLAIIEPRDEYKRDKTWSFWKVFPHNFEDCVKKSWNTFSVNTPNETKYIECKSTPYQTIDSGIFYQKILRSQYLLTKDIIGDSRNDFLCSLTWNRTIFDETKPEKACKIIHDIGLVNWKIYLGLSGKLKGKDAELNSPSYETVQYALRFNEIYFNRLLTVFGKKQIQLVAKLKKSNVEIYSINQQKQIFLLFSMISQLLSFLFLLILFRRLLK